MNPSDVAKENPAGAIDFNFWMPSKQPTKDKGVPKPVYLDEASSEVPGGAFTVQVLNFTILEAGKTYEGLVLPEQRQTNFLSHPRTVELGEQFGLLVSERGIDSGAPDPGARPLLAAWLTRLHLIVAGFAQWHGRAPRYATTHLDESDGAEVVLRLVGME